MLTLTVGGSVNQVILGQNLCSGEAKAKNSLTQRPWRLDAVSLYSSQLR